jgi:hypothetical protein
MKTCKLTPLRESKWLRDTMYSPTHEPQSPAPGEPRGLSKWPLINTDGSVSCKSADDILLSSRS